MVAALNNMALANGVFSGERHRARMASSRVATVIDDDDSEDDRSSEGEEEDDDEEQQRRPRNTVDAVSSTGLPDNSTTARQSLNLAELEEERELQRRRSSVCVLLSAFFLFRLWILALEEGDFGLLLLCMMLTSWTLRWVGMNREREEELDRRIAHYMEHGNDPEMNRNELRMLSFQAQLALAIMESQRQMMQGGYHPQNAASRGVSDEAKATWERFGYEADEDDIEKVTDSDKLKNELEEEAPHCSICLSEYEEGETVIRLPCRHLYHDDCITSWTASHVNCPLCNFDLDTTVVGQSSDDETPADSTN
jgi:hypothetical protein